ncbi:DinB family protein [Cyclobacterium roseum]|uniref:DinB family protein n=1 Tax=Cyclobacterium roseum TaxID=2666137 RepID=UPI001390F91D|nr:DinB family protein [Cyclobacterium roseum]
MVVRWIALLMIMAGTNLHAQEYFEKQYAGVWQRNLNYSKAVAEAMPEAGYDFRPTDEAMSFQEQWLHVADNISMLTSRITGDRKNFYRKEDATGFKKADVMAILDRANAYVLDLIQNASGSQLNEEIEFGGVSMTKENIFYLLRDHQAHHRAQCLVYLRMKGVSAPGYVGW